MIYDTTTVLPFVATTITATTVTADTVDTDMILYDGVETDTLYSDATTVGFFGATAIAQPASANQAAVTLGNANSEIGGLTIGEAYSQAEVAALRDKCEELADDVRNLSTLVHALRTALVDLGLIKGAA